MNKKVILSVLISFFIISPFFAEKWYVCLSSFRVLDNAAKLQTELNENKVKTVIVEYKVDNGSLYRVFVDNPFDSRDKARIYIDTVQKMSAIKAKNLTGLWICSKSDDNKIVVVEKPKAKAPVEEKPAVKASAAKVVEVVAEEPKPVPAPIVEEAPAKPEVKAEINIEPVVEEKIVEEETPVFETLEPEEKEEAFQQEEAFEEASFEEEPMAEAEEEAPAEETSSEPMLLKSEEDFFADWIVGVWDGHFTLVTEFSDPEEYTGPILISETDPESDVLGWDGSTLRQFVYGLLEDLEYVQQDYDFTEGDEYFQLSADKKCLSVKVYSEFDPEYYMEYVFNKR